MWTTFKKLPKRQNGKPTLKRLVIASPLGKSSELAFFICCVTSSTCVLLTSETQFLTCQMEIKTWSGDGREDLMLVKHIKLSASDALTPHGWEDMDSIR